MSKHAFITGVNGFVGGWLAEFLVRSGYRVTGLVRNPTASKHLSRLDMEFIRGDLNDIEVLKKAVSKATTVFHVAGLVRALRKQELFDVNETGARNVFEACASQDTPPNVVLVSSLAAAGPSKNTLWKAENDPLTPVSNYGKSKAAGEQVARSFASKLPISVVRPPIVYGARDTAFAEMIRPIVQIGLHPYPGALPLRRYSMVHVQDLCRALWLVSERGEYLLPSSADDTRGKGVYFVAEPKRYGYIEIGSMIAKAAGVRYMVPSPLFDTICWVGGAINELVGRIRGKAFLVNLDKVREGSAGSWTCSAEKIGRQLAWAPQKTPQERMQETIDWYFSEGWFKPPVGYRQIHPFPAPTPKLNPTRQAS